MTCEDTSTPDHVCGNRNNEEEAKEIQTNAGKIVDKMISAMDKEYTSFYVGDLEVSYDKHVNEASCTQSNSMLESLYNEPLCTNDNMATLLPLHVNHRNKGMEAYDFEKCDEPYVSYTHDINLEEQSKMTLQDDELYQHDNNEMHALKN